MKRILCDRQSEIQRPAPDADERNPSTPNRTTLPWTIIRALGYRGHRGLDYRRGVRDVPPPEGSERRMALWLFLFVASVFLLFQQGTVTGYDGGTMYAVTQSMVDEHTFAIPDAWNTLTGPDGREYGRYGLGLSLVGAIPYVLSK